MMMEMSMRVTGTMTWLKETAFTNMQTEPNTREIGNQINNMETESKHSLTVLNIKEVSKMERNTETVLLSG